ncbi:GNAT family N-acetyltransferase [Actinotalea subterranea]|uniref:GNAT family N-acetyltransferase n=1 Tax=Actinotalea subterranea TaxID=2607497 RepID=UPI0011ED3F60|nr:GNAT family N-acetyltransferase [Actinotalea subterranea]
MTSQTRVLRSDDPGLQALEREGWVVVARSWGARRDTATCDRQHLEALAGRANATGTVRALTTHDVGAVLALDADTAADYPGREATAHAPLTADRAAVGPSRRAHGVVEADGRLVAMTFVDVEPPRAEVDFTVVAQDRRGLGLATAVKAASVLALVDDGVAVVRTGGSADNPAILAANRALGFVVDEEWLTLEGPETAGR